MVRRDQRAKVPRLPFPPSTGTASGGRGVRRASYGHELAPCVCQVMSYVHEPNGASWRKLSASTTSRTKIVARCAHAAALDLRHRGGVSMTQVATQHRASGGAPPTHAVSSSHRRAAWRMRDDADSRIPLLLMSCAQRRSIVDGEGRSRPASHNDPADHPILCLLA